MINESAPSIIEGKMQDVCVRIDHHEGLVKRDVPISISVVPQSGMILCSYTHY